MIKFVVMSDLHCGHISGLTPPQFQGKLLNQHDCSITIDTKHNKIVQLQKDLWKFYTNTLKEIGHIDILLVNGDCIDGHGERNGGVELTTTDCIQQANIASECILAANADNIVITYGTAYHAGDAEDYEGIVAKEVGAKIGSHEWIKIKNNIIDCKHHLGSSSTPHARHTAIAKDRIWNLIWAERHEQPKSNIFIRSHVHYFSYCGGNNFLAITTPALQAANTKYGSRRCSGHVDFGLTSFTFDQKGNYTWQSHLASLPSQKAQVLEF